MTDTLRERVIAAIDNEIVNPDGTVMDDSQRMADAAIAVVVEECAKVCEETEEECLNYPSTMRNLDWWQIQERIRGLAKKGAG